jgi:hypothetical protein
MVPTAK